MVAWRRWLGPASSAIRPVASRRAPLKDRLKIQSAYAAKKADPTGAKAKATGLAAIGDSFGVDLSGFTVGGSKDGK